MHLKLKIVSLTTSTFQLIQYVIRYMPLKSLLLWASLFLSLTTWAQDTLPRFTVTTRGKDKNIVSWTNNYRNVTQISIQRSFDSVRNFRTILSVPDPENIQNGFVDTKAGTDLVYYRLFVVLDSGKYVFTNAKKPFWDTAKVRLPKTTLPSAGLSPINYEQKRVVIEKGVSEKIALEIEKKIKEPELPPVKNSVESKPVVKKVIPEKYFAIKRKDSVLFSITQKEFKKFRDSLITKTKDTMVFRNADTILIKPFIPKEVYKPSVYIFTEKDGNVSIKLPDASIKNYSIKFFDEKMKPLFDLGKVKDSFLLIDKANFLQSGWYRFELYEDGKLKEKNKFFIPKDF
jgi:hypothetical protein